MLEQIDSDRSRIVEKLLSLQAAALIQPAPLTGSLARDKPLKRAKPKSIFFLIYFDAENRFIQNYGKIRNRIERAIHLLATTSGFATFVGSRPREKSSALHVQTRLFQSLMPSLSKIISKVSRQSGRMPLLRATQVSSLLLTSMAMVGKRISWPIKEPH